MGFKNHEQGTSKWSAVTLAMVMVAAFLSFGPETLGQQATTSTASSQEDLQTKIQQKATDLDKINQQLEAARQQLEDARSQRVGLQQDLSRLQSNINQLQLSIKADEVTSQKLNLEIDSLSYDIRDIELAIEDKRKAISKILLTLQQNDNSTPLFILLKNTSLADSVLENQSLQNLKQQLTVDISNLDGLHVDLSGKIDLTKQKQTDIEFHKQAAVARQSIIEDQKQERSIILTQTKNKESAYEQQYKELEKQQNAIEDEISQIEDLLRSRFNTDVLPRARSGVLAWPATLKIDGGTGIITQHYGERSSLYRGKPHNGLDIGEPVGTPVYAADNGVILAVDYNDRSSWRKYQYGRYVLIQHPNGFATLYAHLSKASVQTGDNVSRGQAIGYSGNTGYSTGPHLHLGLYWAPRGICPTSASNPVDCIQMKPIQPAAGLVPIGVTVNPEDYL